MYYFLKDSENSTSSLGQGEESSAECFSDIPRFALLKSSPIAEKSYCSGNGTESFQDSLFGMMCGHSTALLGGESWMSLLEDSLVRILAAPAHEKESKDTEAGYGPSSPGSFAKYDRSSHSLRTRQTSLFEDLTECLVILPKWGMMLNGECFPLAPLVPHICDAGCSLWPTPRADGRDNCGGSNARKQAQRRGTYIGRYPNPILQERLMGWPGWWTDLEPSETDKFQKWLRLLGER